MDDKDEKKVETKKNIAHILMLKRETEDWNC